MPVNQSQRGRIGGIDATTGGEGLIEIEVLSISGECMVTLNVSESMLGRDLWNLILDQIPSKPGLQLVVSHTARLALNESLKQQGLGVNGHRCRLPTSPSICWLPVILPSETALRMKSSHWTGLQKWQGLVTKACLAAQFAQEPSHLGL